MIETILMAASVAFVGTSSAAFAILSFDRWAPVRFVRERHNLALVGLGLMPLLFGVAIQAGKAPAALPPLVAVENTQDLAEMTVAAWEATAPSVYGITLGEQGLPSTEGTVILSRASWRPLAPAAITVWAIGTFVFACRLLAHLRAMTTLKASGRDIRLPDGMRLSRAIPVRRSAAVGGPLLVGYWSPVIMLPESFAFGRGARAVLEHEVAHAIRCDLWLALAVRGLRVVFWWALPLAALERLLTTSRESLCDELAAEVTGQGKALAHALLDVAARGSFAPPLALAAAPDRSSLADRVGLLADESGLAKPRLLSSLPVLACLLTAGAFAATPRFGAAEPALETPPSASRKERNVTGRPTDPSLNHQRDIDVRAGEEDRDLDDHGVENSSLKVVLADGEAALCGNGGEQALDHGRKLLQAAGADNRSLMADLISYSADPSCVLAGEGSPLTAAAYSRNTEAVADLLAAGADPNLPVPGVGSALIAGVHSGSEPIVELLLSSGAFIDMAVPGDGTALIAAARQGNLRLLNVLLGSGADPNASIEGDGNPLVVAVRRGDTRIFDRLIEAGAEPTAFVPGDETPLIAAVQSNQLSLAKRLVELGADVNRAVSATASWDDAGTYDDYVAGRALAFRAADGTAWRSALGEARRRSNPDIATWLVAQGAER